MTIITKPFAEKPKSELVGFAQVENGPNAPSSQGDSDSDRLFLVHSRARRLSSVSTIFLFLSALCVMCMGIIGGVAIYRAYTRDHMRFRGFCGVPYDGDVLEDNNRLLILFNNKLRDVNDNFNDMANAEQLLQPMNITSNDFFKEAFDLDVSDQETYAKIEVPDFRDGRSGRFLHDFSSNQTAIVDSESNRCFVMPLDRETVLPPKSLADVIQKMWSGYYNIDMNVVRKNMRVVLPELTDRSEVSMRIQGECIDKKIYQLEKFTSGVFKRSVDSELTNDGKFAEFSGRLVEFDLVNIKQVNDYEKSKK